MLHRTRAPSSCFRYGPLSVGGGLFFLVGGLERNPPSICIGTKWSYAAACQRTSERFLWALTKWEYIRFFLQYAITLWSQLESQSCSLRSKMRRLLNGRQVNVPHLLLRRDSLVLASLVDLLS